MCPRIPVVEKGFERAENMPSVCERQGKSLHHSPSRTAGRAHTQSENRFVHQIARGRQTKERGSRQTASTSPEAPGPSGSCHRGSRGQAPTLETDEGGLLVPSTFCP